MPHCSQKKHMPSITYGAKFCLHTCVPLPRWHVSARQGHSGASTNLISLWTNQVGGRVFFVCHMYFGKTVVLFRITKQLFFLLSRLERNTEAVRSLVLVASLCPNLLSSFVLLLVCVHIVRLCYLCAPCMIGRRIGECHGAVSFRACL